MDYFDEARTVPLHPKPRKIYQIRDGQVQSLDLIDLKNVKSGKQSTATTTTTDGATSVQQEPAKRPKLFAIEKAPALDKSVQTSLWTKEKSAEHAKRVKSAKYQVFSITQPEIVYYIDTLEDSDEDEFSNKKSAPPPPVMKPRLHPQNLSVSHEVKLDILPNIGKLPGRDEQSQTEIFRQRYGIDKSIPPNKEHFRRQSPVTAPAPPTQQHAQTANRPVSPSTSEPLQIMRPIMIRNRRVEPMWHKDDNLYSMDSINKSMGKYRHYSYY